MARRFVAAVSRVLTPRTQSPAQPHFHRGAQGNVAACFDARCDRPHLDV